MDISNPEFDPIKSFYEFKKWVYENEIFYNEYCREGLILLIGDWLYTIHDYDMITSDWPDRDGTRLDADVKLLIKLWAIANLIYVASKNSNVYYLFKE